MRIAVEFLREGPRAVEAHIRLDLHMNFLDVLLDVRLLSKRSETARDCALVRPLPRVSPHMVEELRNAVVNALTEAGVLAHVEVEQA